MTPINETKNENSPEPTEKLLRICKKYKICVDCETTYPQSAFNEELVLCGNHALKFENFLKKFDEARIKYNSNL